MKTVKELRESTLPFAARTVGGLDRLNSTLDDGFGLQLPPGFGLDPLARDPRLPRTLNAVIPSTSGDTGPCNPNEPSGYLNRLRYLPMTMGTQFGAWITLCSATGSRRLLTRAPGLVTPDDTPFAGARNPGPAPRMPVIVRYQETSLQRRLVAFFHPSSLNRINVDESVRSYDLVEFGQRQFAYTDAMIRSGTDDPTRRILPRFLAIDYLEFSAAGQTEWFLGLAALDPRIWAIGITRSRVFCAPTGIRIPAEYYAGDAVPTDIACHDDRLVVSFRQPRNGAHLGEFSRAAARWSALVELRGLDVGGEDNLRKYGAAIDFDRTTAQLYAMCQRSLYALDRGNQPVRAYDFGVARWGTDRDVNPHIGSALANGDFAPLPTLYAPVLGTVSNENGGTAVTITHLTPAPDGQSFPNMRCEFAVEHNTLIYFNLTDPELPILGVPEPFQDSLWAFQLTSDCAHFLAVINRPPSADRVQIFEFHELRSIVHISLEPWLPWASELFARRSWLKLDDLATIAGFVALPTRDVANAATTGVIAGVAE